ncbi:NUMOD4 domain-containing protein [Spirosoma jeollabukense]
MTNTINSIYKGNTETPLGRTVKKVRSVIVTETWMPLADFEGHCEVSSLGKVRSIQSGRMITPQVSNTGASFISLRPIGSEIGTLRMLILIMP